MPWSFWGLSWGYLKPGSGGVRTKGWVNPATLNSLVVTHAWLGCLRVGVVIRWFWSWAVPCVVIVPVQGLGGKKGRVVDVTTVWQFDEPHAAPRLVTAFPKP
jgi:hypothetical protein